VVVKEGDDISFECDSQGTTNWLFGDPETRTLYDLPSNTRVESNTLHIINVEKSNQGIYECQGQMKEYERGTQDRVKFFARSNLTIGRWHNHIMILDLIILLFIITLIFSNVITLTTERKFCY